MHIYVYIYICTNYRLNSFRKVVLDTPGVSSHGFVGYVPVSAHVYVD